MKRICFLFFAFLCCTYTSHAQNEIKLYDGVIPNSKEAPDQEKKFTVGEGETIITEASRPTLSIYLPSKEKATGTAVIVCPGGGYHALCIDREGWKIAKEFNKLGVAAFVLKYRLPDDAIMKDKSTGPLCDAQQAIKLVRQHAEKWHVDPHKIGIMGFSAGGHLAATAGTHFEKSFIENKEGTSLRPDFMILIYPVISMTDSIGHIGSREFLLGKSPSEEQIRLFSNEYQVNSSTPPSFITQATDDEIVKVENSLLFYNALRKNLVPVELHLFEKGKHGYLQQPSFEEWFGRCQYWMKNHGWIQ
ncbi:MAG: alpha/beta hydrolase [Bacteroidota bacterium]|nr:alpha/beta hydrolase [Bacteroidota bacterium]MDP4205238.1 alpha/beta hydrolase [Bacteroidota bacterium]